MSNDSHFPTIFREIISKITMRFTVGKVYQAFTSYRRKIVFSIHN
ncbi:hypothetical protein EC841_101295 [Raoultella ornithinolytica]|uniref:Uncharacterized protein n=1 Tax=Raoultella ornithinolytica TaxID=54291 RepID=A0ABD7QN90_RAOOR|nr:hypothetical protein EC841_101295 [Raoultella ornithinolytica]